MASMSAFDTSIRLLASASFLVASVAAGCGGGKPGGATTATGTTTTTPPSGADTFAAQKTGPIAPGCASSFCAEVELDATLACHDATSDVKFTLATNIRGKTDQLSCAAVENKAGGLDLHVGVSPDATAGEAEAGKEVWFKLRSYKGPGTYPLENLADDADHMGLKLSGLTTGHSERHATVGTVSCIPKICEAIVAEGSQPIPSGDTVQEFRVRVEIRCPRGGQVGNMLCEEGSTRCTFSETPTLLADLACRQ